VTEKRSQVGSDRRVIELIRDCQTGDYHAWEELVQRYSSRVRATCRRHLRNSADANDLTQEVFLKVFCAIRSVQPEQFPFEGWLLAITRNQLTDHHRRICSQPRVFRSEIVRDRLISAAKQSERPDFICIRDESRARVHQALAMLSPDLRQLTALHYIYEVQQNQIAQLIGIPEGTVKSWLSRARSAMARDLKSYQAAA
jgi:RNA polymerase sigma-70 factor, ECF subfamily